MIVIYTYTYIGTYNNPTAGMFLWLTLNKHKYQSYDSFEIFKLLANNGIIAVPGDDFHVPTLSNIIPVNKSSEDIKQKKDIHLRLTYAASTESQMNIGINRLGNALKNI